MLGGLVNATDQTGVKLEELRRDFDQLEQSGPTGSEIVVGEFNSEVAQLGGEFTKRMQVVDGPLVHLDDHLNVREVLSQDLQGRHDVDAQAFERMRVDEDAVFLAQQPAALDRPLPAQHAQFGLAIDE